MFHYVSVLFIKIHLANNAHMHCPCSFQHTYSNVFWATVCPEVKMGNVENSLEYEKQSYFLYQ